MGLTHSVRIRRLMKKLPLTMGMLAASLGPCKWHVQLPVVVEVSYLHMQTRSTRAHTHTPLHIGPYWQCPFIFTSTMYSVSLPVLGSFCALGPEPSPEQCCWYGAMFDDTECLFMCWLATCLPYSVKNLYLSSSHLCIRLSSAMASGIYLYGLCAGLSIDNCMDIFPPSLQP